MAMVHRSYPGARHFLSHSNLDLTREKPVSRLVILQDVAQPREAAAVPFMMSSQEDLKKLIEQARFQQRQLQEKEEKLLKLYEEQRERALERVGTQKATERRWSGGPPPAKPVPGKVRSLLQSRRDLGNDKSYPLQPLPRTKTYKPGKSTKPSVLYFGGSHQDLRFSDELDFGQSFQVIDDHQLHGAAPLDSDDTEEDYFVKSFKNKRQFYENRFTGVSEESLSDSFDGKVFQKLPNVGGLSMSQKVEAPGRYKTFVAAKTTRIPPPKIGLPTKQTLTSAPSKKTEVAPPSRPRLGLESPTESVRNGTVSSPVRSPPARSIATRVDSPSQLNGRSTPPRSLNGSASKKPLSPPQRTTKTDDSPREATPPVPASRTTVPRPTSATVARASPQKSAATPSNLPGCRICGRNFAADRLATHENICKKSTSKKRKVFDPVKHRVKGTEAEKYVVSGISSKNAKQAEKALAAKPDWRKKHEEFINNIRAAKEVQTYLKKGGKLSDLPPPPPSENPDYVQCPHCQRKFNQAAADRHIPKCATMLHNKPKRISAPIKPSATFRKK